MSQPLNQYYPGGVAKQLQDQIDALDSGGYQGTNPSFLLLSGDTTLNNSYSGYVVSYAGGADITVTVPAGLTNTFNCAFIQEGAGLITIAGGAGVTVHNSRGHLTTFGIYASIGLLAVSPDSYIVTGDVN